MFSEVDSLNNAYMKPEISLDNLCKMQQELAADLVRIGDGLILPGDEDWIEPIAGKDDFTAVGLRA